MCVWWVEGVRAQPDVYLARLPGEGSAGGLLLMSLKITGLWGGHAGNVQLDKLASKEQPCWPMGEGPGLRRTRGWEV